ncbi:hypothetical protein [Pseudobacillus badius]|uniref:hypothetical protein n=1 Tax=Bacillus badius TaxID=1455 RepID=UPI001CBF4FC4|nr:hypothetical protein [Bacillus badius]MED0666740.1 hypothetical protein [Bacillus badius]UAT29614.1 hypothetical protein K7T73_13525 [Bacillus badius]GLY10019.1 hypothetical protein Bbad01_12350 [Bacillus badius]
MKIFLLKISLVLSLFFIGVLIGSFHSQNPQTTSFYGQTEEPPFSFFEQDEAEIDLQKKRERLQDEENVNLFSKAGQSLAEAVTFAAASLFNS